MRRLRLLALLALATLPFPSGAEEVTGRVAAIYREASPGVLMEERLARPRGGARWADVDVDGRRILARLPDEMPLSLGERIAVRVGAPKSSQLAYVLPMTTVSRAIAPDPNASMGR
ncbi:MAG TPA: hypothetical protein VEB41_04300 [Burkholderiales bacterium]|nr:hypothetical protein [Burkholderiales bacterium]